MKKTIDKKKLELSRERIRLMDKKQLVQVVGGVVYSNPGQYCSNGCQTGAY